MKHNKLRKTDYLVYKNIPCSNMSEKEIIEKIESELLDVMQVCATMTYVLEKKYSIGMEEELKKHIEKLKKKGYVKE